MNQEISSFYFIPAGMINEYVYCPRLFYFQWVQAEWKDSADTLKGAFLHKRVDKQKGALPDPDDAKAKNSGWRKVETIPARMED